MNNWSFTGNVGRDAETRFTQGGDAIVSFTVAVKSGFGEKAETTWARCNFWGKRGEAVAPYLVKGAQVGVTGELTLKAWTNKEGVKQQNIEVRVSDLTLLGKREASSEEPAKPTRAKPAPKSDFSDMDEDIPF